MIDLTQITPQALSHEPYRWAFVNKLFSPADCAALVASFPCTNFKTVEGYDGEKGYHYEARSFIALGANAPTHPQSLSRPWQQLAEDLLSAAYREAMSDLTRVDLSELRIEANVFHYGRNAWLGPHVDLADKVVTHVFYFNEVWNEGDGGCLNILAADEVPKIVKVIPPLVGNSVVVVRSDKSWHAVSRVRAKRHHSRRSLTVTFYRPDAQSTLWPANDVTPLHDYTGEPSAIRRFLERSWRRVARR